MSKGGRKFKGDVADMVAASPQRIEGRLQVSIALSCPTKRSYDIDGRIKATLDSLQDAGVFDDDEQVDELIVTRQPVSKGGYCKVVITNVRTEE
jgi:crossover junction endodeoxyribonuclease RusA